VRDEELESRNVALVEVVLAIAAVELESRVAAACRVDPEPHDVLDAHRTIDLVVELRPSPFA